MTIAMLLFNTYQNAHACSLPAPDNSREATWPMKLNRQNNLLNRGRASAEL
jgi:hypothetical protein